MKALRGALFWIHLAAGSIAGAVIVVTSVTGALLALKPQILFARSQLIVDAATVRVVKWEPYDQSSRGQKVRGWFRFAHTGDLAGLPGQLAAGVASASGALLAWTGLALALRRLAGWRLRARLRRPREAVAFD